MPWIKCKLCNSRFYAKPRHIKIGWGKYCSNACLYESMRSGKFVKCDICDKKIYRSKKDLRSSKSKKYFCSRSCQAIWRNTHFNGERHANWKGGESVYRNILVRNQVYEKCRRCGLNDNRILAVHHIDKNRKNNNIENLTWLCHNCHFLIHHDKSEWKKFMVAIV